MEEKVLDMKRDWEKIKKGLDFLDTDEQREAYLKKFIIAKGRS